MAHSPSPDDRPDPSERMPAVRARVPEHVAMGQISTGVIVVTGATEYILDFVRNLPRPNMIVARVVLPHAVMPQFTEALSTNIALYRQRFGEIPNSPAAAASSAPQERLPVPSTAAIGATASESAGPASNAAGPASTRSASDIPLENEALNPPNDAASTVEPNKPTSSGSSSLPASPPPTRHASPQEVYDDLKLRDELLSGAYANAVMIGHGPHEFCFDFITNFYPQSAVSCRVFMAAGHVGRLLDSLRASWDQLRPRLGGSS